MEQRDFGSTGLTIGRVSLGCTTFGREIDEDTCFEIMDHAVENGVTLFDTAEAYGGAQAKEYRRHYLGTDDVREVSGESPLLRDDHRALAQGSQLPRRNRALHQGDYQP